IIDVTDPENPIDLGLAEGPQSNWRDIKVYEHYAYVTNETGGGLMVIDLSNLPNPISPANYYNWAPEILTQGPLGSCHNIYIDDAGYGYLSGCNVNSGGPLFIDLFTDPGNPTFIAIGPTIYSHDIYVRDNVMYSSEIYEGVFTVYDVTDKESVWILASQPTPFNFTHNTWLSDDGNTIFTTDEVGNAPVAAYDISNLEDIVELDQFRPLLTINQGVLPHNVFVWEDWLIISYYTDGCIIADGSRPDNIIEVGNFDTVLPGEGSGAWGVYPFLPSGTILVSDINKGLFILEPNYVRACWLEGTITNAVTGDLLNGARVEIQSTQVNFAESDLGGVYKTGQALPGPFMVNYSLPGYVPQTLEVNLDNGVVTIQDVALVPLANANLGGQVVDADTGTPVPNAVVVISNDDLSYTTTADANGTFNIAAVVLGDYEIIAGAWGHQTDIIQVNHDGMLNPTIPLKSGYADEFILDLGWTELSSASSGIWERGVPIATFGFFNDLVNPDVDVAGDLGDQCYVTGNAGGSFWEDEVSNGFTRLISPMMDLSAVPNPVLSFDYWFVNTSLGNGSGAPDDNLEVVVSNGITEVTIAIFTNSNPNWLSHAVALADYIDITDEMQVTFETADQPGPGHAVEAAIDVFKIEEGDLVSIQDRESLVQLTAQPNPFQSTVQINYQFPANGQVKVLELYNQMGQLIKSQLIDDRQGWWSVGEDLPSGLYLVQLRMDGKMAKTLKVIKQ
ncbi:MAG: choice-of-anchor B family protein, partial [Bacteroidota bacterium]